MVLIPGFVGNVKDAYTGVVKGNLHDAYVSGLKAGCNVYRKYLNRLPLAPLPRAYAETVCKLVERPFPPPLTSEFTGGQSDGVSYQMKYWSLTATGNNNFQPLYRDPSDVLYTWGTTFIGKITGFQLRYPDGRPVSYASYKAAGKNFTQGYYLEIYSQNGTKTDVISFSNSWGIEPSGFVRADGQPDTGGNPVIVLPPDPPIDNKDFSNKVIINNYDVNNNIVGTKEVDLTIPIINIKPEFDFDFNLGGVDFNINMGGLDIKNKISADIDLIKNKIDVELGDVNNRLDLEINPNIDLIKNTLELQIKPSIDLIKNELELEISPDIDLIKNELELEISPDIDLIKNELELEIKPSIDLIKNKLNVEFDNIKNKLNVDISGEFDSVNNKLDLEFESVKNKINSDIDIIEDLIGDISISLNDSDSICKFRRRPFSGGDYDPDDIEESEEAVEEEEKERPDIEWVLLEITKFPPGGKTMLMENSADNTYFAGYFSWFINTDAGQHRLEEIPIRKQKMAFKNPGDVQGYRFYTVNKARIKSTIYYQPQTQTAE